MSEAGAPRVVLVDDHPIWRDTMQKILQRRSSAQVVALASDGIEAVAVATREQPDLVVMDIDMPGMNGVEATRQIGQMRPAPRVLVLSASDDKADVLSSLRAGATGYVLKTAGADEVVDAVTRVLRGELVMPPALAGMVLAELRGGPSDPGVPPPPPAPARLCRSGDVWAITFRGTEAHLIDLTGMQDIANLLGNANQEIHSAALVAARNGHALPDALPARDASTHVTTWGGLGAALDETAKAAYRDRIADLEADLEEATANADVERAHRLRTELELLTTELAAAVGLHGRDRPVASNAERARINVKRAIDRAVKRMDSVHPDAAMHLRRSIVTGTFCVYAPEQTQSWVVELQG